MRFNVANCSRRKRSNHGNCDGNFLAPASRIIHENSWIHRFVPDDSWWKIRNGNQKLPSNYSGLMAALKEVSARFDNSELSIVNARFSFNTRFSRVCEAAFRTSYFYFLDFFVLWGNLEETLREIRSLRSYNAF